MLTFDAVQLTPRGVAAAVDVNDSVEVSCREWSCIVSGRSRAVEERFIVVTKGVDRKIVAPAASS